MTAAIMDQAEQRWPDMIQQQPVPTASCGAFGPGLEVRCFGQFHATFGGRCLEWRREKAKTLLKYLVLQPTPLRQGWLCDSLWEELDADAAARTLRVTMHSLRQTLSACHGRGTSPSPPVILTRRGVYHLNPAIHLWVDTREFMTLVLSGDHARRLGRQEECLSAYQNAVALYCDDFLCDDDEDWTFIPREQLKDHYLIALRCLLDASMTANEFMRAIAYAHRILEKEPCCEGAYIALMRSHAALGQTGQALRWYELCCQALENELRCMPTESTRQLANSIRSRAFRAAHT